MGDDLHLGDAGGGGGEVGEDRAETLGRHCYSYEDGLTDRMSLMSRCMLSNKV